MVITEACDCKEVDTEIEEGEWRVTSKQCTKCWKMITVMVIEAKQKDKE
jgi:hypothetical protein